MPAAVTAARVAASQRDVLWMSPSNSRAAPAVLAALVLQTDGLDKVAGAARAGGVLALDELALRGSGAGKRNKSQC